MLSYIYLFIFSQLFFGMYSRNWWMTTNSIILYYSVYYLEYDTNNFLLSFLLLVFWTIIGFRYLILCKNFLNIITTLINVAILVYFIVFISVFMMDSVRNYSYDLSRFILTRNGSVIITDLLGVGKEALMNLSILFEH